MPVNVIKDNIVEPTETVVLTISSNAAYTIGTGSATVSIADDPAVVSVAATTPNASEVGPTNGLFTITRSGGNLAAALSVSAVISGTATNGGDYAVINTPFSIPANQTSVTVPVNVLKDNVVEPTETVVLTISSNAAYTIGTGSATVSIADDPAVVSVAATTPNASETGPVNGVFTITRSGGNLAAALSVPATISGTATNGGDYAVINTPFSIPANQTSTTVTVVPIVDALSEGNETVILTVQASAAYTLGAQSAATVTISDGAAPSADIAMSMTTNNPNPTIGEAIQFDVNAQNLGPSNATGVVVNDLLPTGYAFVSKTVFAGAYDETTGVWTVATLGNGSTATLRINATVKATGTYTNTATRSASPLPTPSPGTTAQVSRRCRPSAPTSRCR